MLEGSKGDQAKSWHETLHHLSLPSPPHQRLCPPTPNSSKVTLGRPLDIHLPCLIDLHNFFMKHLGRDAH